ncbi:MAG: hypothetical protein Q4D13_07190 [Erysipelotrichaceae bacterium]|nr:hypothetical protein [Erysipelotrichaceae bacterium]
MIKILHMFPNLMNLYGEYANLMVLRKHLEDQGMEVKIDKKDIDSIIVMDNYDMIYMGSGTERNQKIALKELKKYYADLDKFINDGKIVLFTGNAMELLGKSVNEEEALGFVDFTVEEKDKRYAGDVVVENDELGKLVGFINKSSIINGGEDKAMFRYIFKDNSLVDNDYEGYHFSNVYGTHIIGPILVKNPEFMKTIVKKLLPEDKKYQDISYQYEEEGYEITLRELENRK